MKKLLKIFGIFIALLIIVAIAVPFFISAEYVKTQLSAQVKQATGRTLTINGKASVSVLPNIAVKLEDVTLGNPAGFSGKYFAHVKTLSVGAELRPLLNKQVKVTGITVDGTTLNLEEAGSGAKNWNFGSGVKSAPAEKPAEDSKTAKPSPLTIDVIHIRDTVVSYRKFGAQPVKFDAKDISADITMNGTATAVNLNRMALYDGTAKADVKLDTKTNAMAVKLKLDGIQIEPLMTALTGASKLSGAATVEVDVTGKNGEQAAMMRSLNGTTNVKIADGAVKGINIASFLRDAKRGFILGNSTTEKTDFTELTASLQIANGIASNNDLMMKSPVLRLTGEGSLDVAARTINYRAVPEIVGTLQGQGGKAMRGLAVPLLITGPWSAISVNPDVAGLVNEAIKNPEAIKQNIKDIGETMRDFNSPKDIGKALFGMPKE